MEESDGGAEFSGLNSRKAGQPAAGMSTMVSSVDVREVRAMRDREALCRRVLTARAAVVQAKRDCACVDACRSGRCGSDAARRELVAALSALEDTWHLVTTD